MIVLFDKNEKKFNTLGIGVLSDAKTCTVNEELNGEYVLEMEYPINGVYYNDIQSKRFILAKPNSYSKPQPFRIYEITKPIDGIVSVKAEHISYDLSGYPVKQVDTSEFQNEVNKVQAALNSLKKNSVLPSMPFNFKAELDSKTEFKTVNPSNARSMLASNDGSILATYNGELIFDGYDVTIVKNRGFDRGYHIKYGKNMTDLEQEIDSSKLYTGVYPYYFAKETNSVTTKKMTYLGAYVIAKAEPYRKGWLTNIPPTGNITDNIPTAYLVKNNPIVIKTEDDILYEGKTYNVTNQVFIYTENKSGSEITVEYEDNKGVKTTITVADGDGYYKRVDTEYTRVYIRPDSTQLAHDWLSSEKDGPAIEPQEGVIYQVWTEGLYYNYLYAWIPLLGENGKYFQIGASVLNAYIKNVDVYLADGVEKGLDTYTRDDFLTSNRYKITPNDFETQGQVLYKIAAKKGEYSPGVYYWDAEQALYIKTEPDNVRGSKWLSSGSPTQTAITPTRNINTTYIVQNTDLENQNGKFYTWISSDDEDENKNFYYKLSDTRIWYPQVPLTKTESVETNNGVYLPEGVIYLGSVDCYIRDAEQYSKVWLSLTSDGDALVPEEGVPYRIVTEDSELKYKTYYWTGTKYVDAGSDECPIVHNIYTMDNTEEFDEVPSVDALRTKTYELLKNSDVGQLTESTKVSFIRLSDSEEYKQFKELEKVVLGDIVHVEYPELGVKTLLKVISAEYDVLLDKYNEIELGTTKATIVNNIVCKNDKISSLTNDTGYTDETTVNQLIAKTVTAEYLKAQNAELTDAQIAQLAAGNIRVSGDVNVTSGSILIQNENGTNMFEVTAEGDMTANSAAIKGDITATNLTCTNGNIGGFSIGRNGLSYDSSNGSVHVGTDGITLGDKFKVDTSGNVTANGFLTWDSVTRALDDQSKGFYRNRDDDNKMYVTSLSAVKGTIGPLKITDDELVFNENVGGASYPAFGLSKNRKYLYNRVNNVMTSLGLAIGVNTVDPSRSDMRYNYNLIIGGDSAHPSAGIEILRVFPSNEAGALAKVYDPQLLSGLICWDPKCYHSNYWNAGSNKVTLFGFQEVSITNNSDSIITSNFEIHHATQIIAAWAVDKSTPYDSTIGLSWSGSTIQASVKNTGSTERVFYLFYIFY